LPLDGGASPFVVPLAASSEDAEAGHGAEQRPTSQALAQGLPEESRVALAASGLAGADQHPSWAWFAPPPMAAESSVLVVTPSTSEPRTDTSHFDLHARKRRASVAGKAGAAPPGLPTAAPASASRVVTGAVPRARAAVPPLAVHIIKGLESAPHAAIAAVLPSFGSAAHPGDVGSPPIEDISAVAAGAGSSVLASAAAAASRPPAVESSPQAISPASPAGGLQYLGLHVLLADDERVNRMIFGRFLQRLGCTFVAVGEGDDAVTELERTGQLPQQPQGHAVGARGLPTEGAARPFDIVFLDIVMCRTDGAQTCREMRRRGLRLPIIAATGNRACIEYTEAGFDAVLEKPFGQGAVEALLREHVLARRESPAADADSATEL